MGGAADNPQRSSSPMKRRASDLDEEAANIERPQLVLGKANADTPMESIEETTYRPSIDEQIASVTYMVKEHTARQPNPGDKTYLVSNQWLQRVQARGSTAKARPEDLEGEIGPIDNSDIVQQPLTDSNGEVFAKLRSETSSESYTEFSEAAWEYILKLYGIKDGQIPVTRVAVNTNTAADGVPNVQYELNPPVLTVHRLWSAHSPDPLPASMKAKDPKAPIFVMSRGSLYVDLLKGMKKVTEIESYKTVRIWRAVKALPTGPQPMQASAQPSPPPSRPNSPAPERSNRWAKLLVSVDEFVKLERGTDRELVDVKDHSANKNYNGKSFTIDMAGLGADQDLFLDESIDKDNFLSTYSASTASSVPISSMRGIASKSQINSGRNSPAPSGPLTRGRTGKSSGKTLGAVGLSNLGNTCYMNSALQCVRNVEELTKYFLMDEANEELNVDNPLGNNGEVAIQYGALLKEIYRCPVPNSVTPRAFKHTIGRYAPSFSGYGQQDSQEFLGFLLDGLQEDLSRVKKKPYIEKPDSTDEMVNNDELIREMADKVWDITKKRDDSVIADLFTGMYKSTLVCPICDKVSITFDPFNNLTLQLPIESIWKHEVFYFPLNGLPLRICVELDKQASIKAVKQFVGKRVGVPHERLFISESFKHKFYKHYYEDLKAASEEIMTNDEILVFELESIPTNCSPAKLKAKGSRLIPDNNDGDVVPYWDDPMSERLLVPVLHRKRIDSRNHYKKWEMVPIPHFIVVTPEEARSEDIIRRKVLEKVASFTTYPPFHEDENEEDLGDSTDPDLVVTTSSDADSSNDGKIVATSVDGEDDVVDVTMGNSCSEQSNSTAPTSTGPARRNGKFIVSGRRPRWIDPKEQVVPELQQLFSLRYFSNPRELIPVGWQIVGEDTAYPLLSTRGLREDSPVERFNGQAANGAGASESEVSDEDDDLEVTAPTRMNEESSDEDELSLQQPLPLRPAAATLGTKVRNTSNLRRLKTYSRKGLQPSSYHRQPIDDSSEEADAMDDGPLIRLGEGIIVDWSREAYDIVFSKDPNDNLRGVPTYEDINLLEDPELSAKRTARDRRKKNGITLDECLDEFGKEEILSEQDTWYCPRCKEHRRASKKFELWKTPDILVMHLKRFSSSGHRRDKLDVEVDFPLQGLDLTSRVIDKQTGKLEVYDLFAVDDHWGGLGGGHYTAFAKSFVDGEWYEYNDSSVSKSGTANIVSKGAYLLFYRRRSDVPLGGPRFKTIIDKFDNPPQDLEDDESGEGRRLDGVSSQLGSSSALTGAGAVHPASGSAGEQKNRSLISRSSAVLGAADPSQIEHLPAYSEHSQHQDGAPILEKDAIMNDGLELDDEGVDVGGSPGHTGGFTSINQPAWNWSALNDTNNGSALDDVSDRSDVAAHQSSAGESSLNARLQEFDNTPLDYEQDEDYEPEMEVPDLDEDAQAGMIGLHEDLREQATLGLQYQSEVTVNDDDEPATEIHVEEGEGLDRK